MAQYPIRGSVKTFFFVSIPIGIMFLAYAGYAAGQGMREVYFDFHEMVIVGICILIGLSLVIYPLRIDNLRLYQDRLEVRSVFGRLRKQIRTKDITGWTEVDENTKGLLFKKFVIYTATTKYIVKTNVYDNADTIVYHLRSGVSRNAAAQEKDDRRYAVRFGFAFSLIGLFLGYEGYVAFQDGTVPAPSLHVVTDIVTSREIIRRGSKPNHTYLDLKLRNQPEFTFEINNHDFGASNAKEFVADVHPGDSVFVYIDQIEFEKKIARTRPLSYSDKHDSYNTIRVYGLESVQYEYLSSEEVKERAQSGTTTALILLGFVGLLFFCLGGIILYSALSTKHTRTKQTSI